MEPETQGKASHELAPEKRRKQPGNLRHGLRAGGLPRGCAYLERELSQLRQALERAVVEVHGGIDIARAAFVNTAVRAEQHARLCQRWLRLEAATMSAADRLSYSREVMRASLERDKAIASLRLTMTDAEKLRRRLYGRSRLAGNQQGGTENE